MKDNNVHKAKKIEFGPSRILIVQLGPGLKSKTKPLNQNRTLNLLWTHPPTKNFSKGSRLSRKTTKIRPQKA